MDIGEGRRKKRTAFFDLLVKIFDFGGVRDTATQHS